MPTNSSTQVAENLPRAILLVEEYGALAVAISSALRKFAPLHGVEVVHNFSEAEHIAATMRPELFVLDIDPPPSGEIEFFNRLKTRYPEARVLVIAAGISAELRGERGTAGAIQFIEKPFDLAEFGAAIQALVGPWGSPGTAGPRGTLRHLQAIDIVQLKCLAGNTGAVRVEPGGDKFGQIFFQKGQISHALTGTLSGLPALEEIMRWPGARLSEVEPPAETPHTISGAWETILLQLIRKTSPQQRRSLGAVPPPRQSGRKTGKKILVVDDTDMLRIFVADVLGNEDPNLRILTTSTGAEGLKLAASERPDLILLDYSLTDVTGDQVCRALLGNPATARIPVLMMSGHLSELAKTAEDYENVVASLPKPFLSGTLINEVEKVLAGGLLPKSPQPKPGSTPAPQVSPAGMAGPAARSTEGLGTAPASGVDLSSPVSPQRSQPLPPPVLPKDRPPPPVPPAPGSASSGNGLVGGVRPEIGSRVRVTYAFRIVALQLDARLQMKTATLQPFDRVVAVSLGEEPGSASTESGFYLGEIYLGAHRHIERLRLLPVRRPPQLPLPSPIFAVDGSHFEPAATEPGLTLAASAKGPMPVRLSAQCELVSVELSPAFEVAAILLGTCANSVRICTGGESSGSLFELMEARLDPSGGFESLLVRKQA